MFSKFLTSSASASATTAVTQAPVVAATTINGNATTAIRALFALRSLHIKPQVPQQQQQHQCSASCSHRRIHSHVRSFSSSTNAQSQLQQDDVFDNPFASVQSIGSTPYAEYKPEDFATPRSERPARETEFSSDRRSGGRDSGRMGGAGGGRTALGFDQSNADLGEPESSASLLGERTDVSKPPVLNAEGQISLNPEDFPMCSELLDTLKNSYNIEKFYPVQAHCFHPIAKGLDVVGRSHTGTGKTLAFVLPIVQRLINLNVDPRRGEGTILVMEPTRELANQVATEIRKLSPKVRVVTVFGGVSYENQRRMIAHGVDIVVGTPGRLMDLINQGYASFEHTHAVVLDEADEMLRMGFRQQIEDILRSTQVGRQILLFSATLPSWVQEVSRKHLRNPMTIDMVKNGEDTPSTIQHYAIASKPQFEVRVELVRELVKHTKGRVIVFVNRKFDADKFNESPLGCRSAALHGDLSQNQRDRVMKDFRSGITKVLFATDIAARGLDIPNVDLVIQLDLPGQQEFYVHRSGRTGRAGKLGRSVMIYTPSNRGEIVALSRQINTPFRFIPPPPIQGMPCSILNGERGMVSVKIGGTKNSRDFESEVRRLVPQYLKPITPEFVVDGMVLDIPIPVYQAIVKAQAEASNPRFANMSVLTEFPKELLKGDLIYRGRSNQGFGRSGPGSGSGRSSGSSSSNNYRNNSSFDEIDSRNSRSRDVNMGRHRDPFEERQSYNRPTFRTERY